MNDLIDKVARAVLYEGHILYPYRASSRKTRERFIFGRVYPRAYSDAQNGSEPCLMQTECLARRTGVAGSIAARVRFLHPMAREVWTALPSGEPLELVSELRIDGKLHQTRHEAVERDIVLPEAALGRKLRQTVDFYFPGTQTEEVLHDQEGRVAGVIRREQATIAGDVEIAIEPAGDRLAKVHILLTNRTPMSGLDDPEAVLLNTFASTHTILRATGAEFVSVTDPPADYALATTTCENIGTWPVLVGDAEKEECDAMLSSPIILYDYPQIAPQSPGELGDRLEGDEILSRRGPAMTDAEQQEMRSPDAYTRRNLDRTESPHGGQLLKMHGALRSAQMPESYFFDEQSHLDTVCIEGVWHLAGDRVRIKPASRTDALDMMLAGKIGIIEAIEQDAEDRVHLALVLEDDPGRELGMLRQPGHRFFYGLDEVEPVREET